jgi:hypothetical protein
VKQLSRANKPWWPQPNWGLALHDTYLTVTQEVFEMRTVRVFVLSVLAVAAMSFQAKAESFDHINIHVPYTVMAGEQQLAPGDYMLQRISDTANIFAIYKDGTTFETFLMAVPANRVVPSDRTELTLRTDGRDFILDKVWVTGSTTGYEFLSPESFKARERERRAADLSRQKGA